MIWEICKMLIDTFFIKVCVTRTVTALVPDSHDVLCVAHATSDSLVEGLAWLRYTNFAEGIESKYQHRAHEHERLYFLV